MPKLFGTDGVRGTANTELTPELALFLGKAAGHLLAAQAAHPRVVVGRDTRASGEMLEAALAAGLCSAGVDVISAGVITTPAIATSTRLGDFAAGAVVSASHNPAAENGIKFLGPDGAKLADTTEGEIEALVDVLRGTAAHAGPPLSGAKVGRYHEDLQPREVYAQAARSSCAESLQGIRMVMDGANGAGHQINADILDSLDVSLTRIHCDPDGWNINKDCGSTHPEDMRRAVVEQGADLGAAFDGDGDRVILCDANGEIVDGDRVMAICAHQWANTPGLPNNIVVGTVMSNMGLEKSLEAIGVTLLRTGVGDRYVAEKMRETGAAVGGEKSGHVIFSQHATTGDGLVTLLQILGLMARAGKPLADLAAVMEEYPQILIGVRVKSREGWDTRPEVLETMAAAHRALAGKGRLLVRPSGTEPIIRIMAEGPDKSELETLTQSIAKAIQNADAAR
jgi:phosphoglucosamine mutase